MSEQQDLGSVEIFDDVIRTIAGVAVSAIEGIAGMRGTFIDGIKQAISDKKNFNAGVDVKKDPDGDAITIDLFVIINYDVKIAEVALKAQSVVKEKVESLTGKKVNAVNVHVADIKLPDSISSRTAEA
jgi:uncharacterized alkaline shock family protein YloU